MNHYLERAIDQNFAARLAEQADLGRAYAEQTDCCWVDSGLASDTFNVVFCQGQHAVACLADAQAYFQRRSAPYAVWLAPAAQPACRPLVASGANAPQPELGMTLPLAELRPADLPEGLQIAEVHAAEELRAFAGVLAGAQEPVDPQVFEFYRRCEARLAPGSITRRFLVYDGPRAVATCEVFQPGSVVGVYNVATHPAYRGRGIAAALVVRAVHEGHRSGASLAVLQADHRAQGLYARLGFEPREWYEVYAVPG